MTALCRASAIYLVALAIFVANNGCSAADPVPQARRLDYKGDAQTLVQSLPDPFHKDVKLAAVITALATGYPAEFQGVEIGDQRLVVWLAGGKFVYDDGMTKSVEQRLDRPDIKDMFCQTYPLTNPTDRLPKDFDPGRCRVEPLFCALYGGSRAAVEKNCVTVEFCGHAVKFNARCDAAEALRRVSADLKPVLARRPDLRSYVENLGGTFSWRRIAGTERLSNHAFGTAIDLNVAKSAYWRWQPPAQMATFSRKGWPTELIETFERHGFIWGREMVALRHHALRIPPSGNHRLRESKRSAVI
jgi:hypothetical protein